MVSTIRTVAVILNNKYITVNYTGTTTICSTVDSGIKSSAGLGLGLCGAGETSLSEWSEEEEGGGSEPLLDHDQDSTGYATDDPALDHASMMNDTGLTDAEGWS